MSMLGFLGSLAASALGPLISTAGELYASHENIKHQDYWNERSIELANSAHQRERADLEAAGLNPILAANSGAATPSLPAAKVRNPTSSFGENARQLQNALTGQTNAEVALTKANASSAKAYADNAEAVAEAEKLEAQARASIVENEDWDSGNKRLNSTIEDWARHEALTGVQIADLDDYIKGDEGWETYRNLVQMYRNDIKSGKYKSSLGRAVFQDVLDGSSSAAQIYHNVKGRQPGKVRP